MIMKLLSHFPLTCESYEKIIVLLLEYKLIDRENYNWIKSHNIKFIELNKLKNITNLNGKLIASEWIKVEV